MSESECCELPEDEGSLVKDYFVESDHEEFDLDKINEKIKQINKEVNQFLERTKKLDIPIDWDLPELHEAKNGLTRTRRKGVKKETLNSKEINYLMTRLNEFCEKYNVDFDRFLFLTSGKSFIRRIPNDLRLKFIQYLSKDLSDRTPYAVYSFICRLGLRKGRFTPDEDAFLMEVYYSYTGPHLYSLCGLLLNRRRYNIYRRFKRLQILHDVGPRPKTEHKSAVEVSNVVLNGLLYKSPPSKKRLGSNFSTSMWLALGNNYGISPALAKGVFFCDLRPRLYSEHPVYYHELCAKLISNLHKEEWVEWTDISWTRLNRRTMNVGPVFLYLLLRKLVMKCVPEKKWSKLEECVSHLYYKYLPSLMDESLNKKFVMKSIILRK